MCWNVIKFQWIHANERLYIEKVRFCNKPNPMSMLHMTPKIGNRRDIGLLVFHGLLTCLKKSLRKGNRQWRCRHQSRVFFSLSWQEVCIPVFFSKWRDFCLIYTVIPFFRNNIWVQIHFSDDLFVYILKHFSCDLAVGE